MTEPRKTAYRSDSSGEGSEKTPRLPARRRRRPPRKAFDTLILLVILGLVGYGVYRYYDDIVVALYSRTAMVVLVVMVIEFLILKSFDRTRLYRIENHRLVRRRMADLQAMREAESALADLIREPPMAPTEVLRRRQLKGSMVAQDSDEEEDPNKTPLEDSLGRFREEDANRAPTPASPETEESAADSPVAGSHPATPGPEALQAGRRALRHIRKRIY